ncbi:MAG: oxidoreductase [Candidatus Binatia bacterium]|nr:MAG: oxidoreductase [Candidatus Binatia bacterium]
MKYTSLGRSGVKVSRLCLGTMNFGRETDEKESFAILDEALDAGINFLDTANVYGGKRGEGVTEQILGRWFAQGGGRRERVVLATKVYGRTGDGPNDRGLSFYHVRRACEESLRRLRTDRIDLYQMHHVDRETPWEEIWLAMEQLVREGKVLYVGSSNFAGWHIATANQIAARRGFLGLVSEQSKYNLVTRTVELEVVPACLEYGVGLLPWSPLAGGVLAGGVGAAAQGRRAGRTALELAERHHESLEKYEAFCRDLGEEPAVVALAWLLSNPAVTAPVIGPRTVDQLRGALRSLDVSLGPEAQKALDEIWPGPGGPAPEAYAW